MNTQGIQKLWITTILAFVMSGIFPWVSEASEENTNPQAEMCEYGITLAMAGKLDEAENAFVSLLSKAPGDARAYLNLGNINFLRGQLNVAMVFYDKALSTDENDAGIHLNRATTLMMMGDDEAARTEAALSIEKAGSPAAAAALAGLEAGMETPNRDKASGKPYVSKQEVKDLLTASAEKGAGAMAADDEPDSLEAAGEPVLKKRKRMWRSGAPRAADVTDSALVLYWKQ